MMRKLWWTQTAVGTGSEFWCDQMNTCALGALLGLDQSSVTRKSGSIRGEGDSDEDRHCVGRPVDPRTEVCRVSQSWDGCRVDQS